MTANGSRRFFEYEADNGLKYGVELDESVYETAALGFGQTIAGGTPAIQAGQSRPFSLRKVFGQRKDGNDTIRRSFFVGTRTALDALVQAGTVTVDGNEYSLTNSKGEQVRIIPSKDTAQLDGDEDVVVTSGV